MRVMKRVNQGFSIIEVLIAFVILVIGILGSATLIIRSSQVNMLSYETDQVSLLSNAFIERIKANSDYINKYVELQSEPQLVSKCISGKDDFCEVDDRVKTDLYYFKEQLVNTKLPDPGWKLVQRKGDFMQLVDGRLYELEITWGSEASKRSYYTSFAVRQKQR